MAPPQGMVSNMGRNVLGYYNVFMLIEDFLEIMERKGLSKSDLACLVGVTDLEISEWFAADKPLSIVHATAIAQALGVELKIELIPRDGKCSVFECRDLGNREFPKGWSGAQSSFRLCPAHFDRLFRDRRPITLDINGAERILTVS